MDRVQKNRLMFLAALEESKKEYERIYWTCGSTQIGDAGWNEMVRVARKIELLEKKI